jgi:hypothetical protein
MVYGDAAIIFLIYGWCMATLQNSFDLWVVYGDAAKKI